MPSKEWKTHDSVWYRLSGNDNQSKKIAAFDMDHTLIKPKSGKTFPKDHDDWEYMSNTKKILQKCVKDGYTLAIFTNQKRFDEGLLDKMDKVFGPWLNEVSIFVSTMGDKYRKPMTSAWQLFLDLTDIKPDLPNSFYCGDMDSDHMFAHNIGIKFKLINSSIRKDKLKGSLNGSGSKIPNSKEKTLEKRGVNSCDNEPVYEYGVDLNKYVQKEGDKNELEKVKPKFNRELVILIGLPGSGKSFVSNYLKTKHGYEVVNQDTLKTKAKCLKRTEEVMRSGTNLIIDNTNVSSEKREPYIRLAKKWDYKVRAVILMNPFKQCVHMDNYRCQIGIRDKPLNAVVFRTMRKQWEELDKEKEGIHEVIRITNKVKDPSKEYFYWYNLI